MTETTQLDRPAPWRKAHRRRLALAGLGPTEQHLLLVLDMLGARDPTRLVNRLPAPDVGWATREDGRALTRRELAAHLRLAPGAAGLADLEAAIAGLVELGHAVVADDGAVGVTGWADLQETPDARRMREQRANRSAPPPEPTSNATRTPSEQLANGRPQKTEDRRQNSEPVDAGADTREPFDPASVAGRIRDAREHGAAPLPVEAASKRVGIPASTLRDLEAGRASPTRPELEALARTYGDPSLLDLPVLELGPGVPEQVLGALFEARRGLGAEEPRPRLDADVVRYVHAPEPWLPEGLSLLDAWLMVIRRFAEEARRNYEDGRGRGSRDLEFLTLRSLARDDRFRRYLGQHDLDKRREPSPGAHVTVRPGRQYGRGGGL